MEEKLRRSILGYLAYTGTAEIADLEDTFGRNLDGILAQMHLDREINLSNYNGLRQASQNIPR